MHEYAWHFIWHYLGIANQLSSSKLCESFWVYLYFQKTGDLQKTYEIVEK